MVPYSMDRGHATGLTAMLLVLLWTAGCSQLPAHWRPTRKAPPVARATAPAATTGSPVLSEASAPMPDERPVAAQAAWTLARMADLALPLEGETAPPPEKTQPPSLWQRLVADYGLPATDNRRVRSQLRWFQAHPDYLPRVLQRGAPYLGWILDQVEQQGLPGELALLPVVESGFQPFAYSHGRASGLWQFIPGTGRRFGLRQNWWYDGRRDLVASTRAALAYLQYLHDELHGDWLLALAAYNSGEGTVAKAVAYNRRHGRPTDFWHLRLPRETRDYVPRLLAIARLVRQPAAYGLALPSLDNQPPVETVDTGGQIDLALAAELAGISLDRLYLLNPGFNRWATPPRGPHRLLLPTPAAKRFRAALARLPASRRVHWARHRIRKGETLSTIALHYRTTVAVLRQTNGLRGNRIRAGRYLLIPVARRKLADYRLSLTGRRRQRVAAGRRTYRVRRGDSLWTIARRYGVSTRTLARWNGLGLGDVLRPGRRLVVTAGRRAAPRPVSWRRTAAVRRLRYRVRRGDSLALISRRFRVSIRDLCRWNGIRRDQYLHPGQRLKLYVDVTRQFGSS